MKILLNLLPVEKREGAERTLRFRFLAWQLFLFLTVEVLYAGILGFTVFSLSVERNAQEAFDIQTAQNQEEERRLREFETVFQEANAAADHAMKIESEHIDFTRLLGDIERVTTEPIALDTISTKDYQVFLSGVASDRDELILYKDRLSQVSCFKNVNMPFSNLFDQKDVVFQIDFSVDAKCLHIRKL